MNRRELLLGLFAAGLASAQVRTPAQVAEYNEFSNLIGNFEKKFNLVINDVIDNKWDMKLAEDTVKAFNEMTAHPMWMMRNKEKK